VGDLVSAAAPDSPSRRKKSVKMSRGKAPLRQIRRCNIAAFAAG
jgi:hypothetical protein